MKLSTLSLIATIGFALACVINLHMVFAYHMPLCSVVAVFQAIAAVFNLHTYWAHRETESYGARH